MDPAIWGKHAWHFLHCVGFAYPEHPTEQQIEQYRDFFHSLADTLPCPDCRRNYRVHLLAHPLTDQIMESPRSLQDWIIDVHNIVNIINDKPIVDPETVRKRYRAIYSGTKSRLRSIAASMMDDHKVMVIVALLVGLIAGLAIRNHTTIFR